MRERLFKAPCKWTQHCLATNPNIVGCYKSHLFAHPVTCCWMLLRVVAQSLKPVKLFSQQLPTFLLFRDRRSVAQQCWIRLHSSSNIVGAMHAHYTWITKTYGLYSSHNALQVPNLLGVVASVCTPLPTRTQQLPTMLSQQCWELLHLSCMQPKTVTVDFRFFVKLACLSLHKLRAAVIERKTIKLTLFTMFFYNILQCYKKIQMYI